MAWFSQRIKSKYRKIEDSKNVKLMTDDWESAIFRIKEGLKHLILLLIYYVKMYRNRKFCNAFRTECLNVNGL